MAKVRAPRSWPRGCPGPPPASSDMGRPGLLSSDTRRTRSFRVHFRQPRARSEGAGVRGPGSLLPFLLLDPEYGWWRAELVGVRGERALAPRALEETASHTAYGERGALRAGIGASAHLVHVLHPAAQAYPVPRSHPARRSSTLCASRHLRSSYRDPLIWARSRSPCAKARSTRDMTSCGEKAPTCPFCMATTFPSSSVAIVRRP